MNFQASELARVLLLTYLASYVVRKQQELKDELRGFLKPLGILMSVVLRTCSSRHWMLPTWLRSCGALILLRRCYGLDWAATCWCVTVASAAR